VAYGYSLLGKPKPEKKSDLFVGEIYTVTSCLVELNRLKRALDLAKAVSNVDEVTRLNGEIADWVAIAAELEAKFPALFEALLKKVGEAENPEEEVGRLNRAYEDGEPKAKQLIREVSDLCLTGFRETLERLEVCYDSWDWESDFVWSSQVGEALRKLKQSTFVRSEGGVLEFDADKVVRVLGLKKGGGVK
jgi:arginyl-tRNA synthetase